MKIGFFVSPLITDSPRGTASVAKHVIASLTELENLQIYAIYNRHELSDDHLGNYYSAKTFTHLDFDSIPNIAAKYWNFDPISSKLQLEVSSNSSSFVKVNYALIKVLSIISRKHQMQIFKILKSTFKSLVSLFPPKLVSLIHRLRLEIELQTSQKKHLDIHEDEMQILDIASFDLILNFWWFHSKFPNPTSELSNPDNLKLLSWVYDLIPLRVENHGGSGISPKLFKEEVRKHVDRSPNIVCISEEVRKDLVTYIKRNQVSKVIPCGIRLETYLESVRDVSKNPGSVILIGTIEPTKNFVRTLNALQISLELGAKITTVDVIGPFNPTIKRDFETLARLGLTINIHGPVDEHKKIQLLAMAELLIYPSISEGFGIPVIEALALSTKVICGNVGIPDAEDMSGIMQVDPFAVEDIAEKIFLQLKKPLKVEREVNDTKFLAEYDWKNIVKRLVQESWR